MIKTKRLVYKTDEGTTFIDVTSEVKEVVSEAGITDGLVNVFSKHTTCAVFIMEYEPGTIKDTEDFFEGIMPYGGDYEHNRINNDHNAASHLRASILGHSLTVPIIKGELALGTWQSTVFVDLDKTSRSREIIVTLSS